MAYGCQTPSAQRRSDQKFLGVAGVSGIVTFHNSSLKILTNIRQLPVEATVSVIKKKGSDYFKLV